MGQRDRLIACVVVALIVVVAAWLGLVSPERSKASSLLSQINSERATLVSDQSQLASAREARAVYPDEVHALTVLLNAIPTSDEEPQLITLINKLEDGHLIQWHATSFGSSSADGFQAIELSFSFTASYVNLQQFIAALDALDETDGANVVAKGRLVNVNSLSLSGDSGATSASVTMTVYEQPSGGATGATGAVTTTAATP
ncbi:MAG: hypothetical protein ABSC56_08605 [Solirubrobacteraceae bacterium]|jgi:Tfp pilus assembly protein PilO